MCSFFAPTTPHAASWPRRCSATWRAIGFHAYSAGLEPTEVHPLTRQVLVEAGIDVSGLRAKGVNEFLGKASVQYAIAVCGEAEWQCPRLFPFAVTQLRWPFEDPAQASGTDAERHAKFRGVRDAIEARLHGWLREQGD